MVSSNLQLLLRGYHSSKCSAVSFIVELCSLQIVARMLGCDIVLLLTLWVSDSPDRPFPRATLQSEPVAHGTLEEFGRGVTFALLTSAAAANG